MERALTIAKIAALTSITLVGAAMFVLLLQLSDAERQARAQGAVMARGVMSLIAKMNLAADTINAPCTDNGHQYVCGTLANVNQTTKNVGILAAQGAEQVKQSGVLIQATTRNLDAAGKSVVDLASTTDASVADLVRSASRTLDAATSTISDAQPVLRAANGAITDFSRFITAPALEDTTTNIASMTKSWAAISVDGNKVVDKATADYLKPVPWYLWPIKRGGEILDVSAAVARHTP